MAQNSPIWYDSPSFEDEASELDWTNLRQPASRSRVPRVDRGVFLWLLVLIVLGGAGAALYFGVEWGSKGESATAVSNTETPKMPIVSRTGKKTGDVRSRTRAVASSDRSPAPQFEPTQSVTSSWPDVSPPIHVDVLTSSGHVPIQVSSLAYRVDIASGAVVLVRSGFGAPVLTEPKFSIRGESKQALNNIEGTVVLRVISDAVGKVREVQVVSGPPPLAAAAIDAVRHWRFALPAHDSEPAEHDTTVTISFKSSP